MPVEYGTAPTVVGPTVAPSYQSAPAITVPPSTMAPSTVAPSTVAPSAPVDTPNDLDAIPRYKIGPPGNGGSSSSTSTAPKTSYRGARSSSGTRIARYRNENVARTMVSAPEPTPRSAQAAPAALGVSSPGAGASDPLDNLPPLDLPGEVTRQGEAAAAPAPSVTAQPQPVNRSPSAKGTSGQAETPAPTGADAVPATAPAPDPVPTASVGPGMTRFVAVDLKLAGGAAPATPGLQWLVDKGYRTLLDLREPSEVPTSFITEVTKRGLRYIALPINAKSIDREHVDRFQFEVAAAEARPLFFFDSDGTRAGLLWYIRRIVVDQIDPQMARREAEELGLSDPAAWLSATRYLAKTAPSQAGPTATARPAASDSRPAAAG